MSTTNAVSAGLTGASIVSAAGSMTGIFPVVAAIIAALAGLSAIANYSVTTYESVTFQKWLATRRLTKQTKKLDRIRREQIELTAKLAALARIEEALRDAKSIIEDGKQGVYLHTVTPPYTTSRLPDLSSAASDVSGPTGTH